MFQPRIQNPIPNLFSAYAHPMHDQGGLTSPSAGDGQTQAVDQVEVDPKADAFSALQSLVNDVTQAGSKEGVLAALESLKQFLGSKTASNLGGPLIDAISDVVESVLSDPGALTDSFALSFSVSYIQQAQASEGYYEASRELSVSFSLITEDTAFAAGYNFKEGMRTAGGVQQYYMQEEAFATLITTDASPKGLQDVIGGLADKFAKVMQDFVSQSLLPQDNLKKADKLIQASMLQFTTLVDQSELAGSMIEYLKDTLTAFNESQLPPESYKDQEPLAA